MIRKSSKSHNIDEMLHTLRVYRTVFDRSVVVLILELTATILHHLQSSCFIKVCTPWHFDLLHDTSSDHELKDNIFISARLRPGKDRAFGRVCACMSVCI